MRMCGCSKDVWNHLLPGFKWKFTRETIYFTLSLSLSCTLSLSCSLSLSYSLTLSRFLTLSLTLLLSLTVLHTHTRLVLYHQDLSLPCVRDVFIGPCSS